MIDCKKYADEILGSVTGYGHLAVISVGDDPASQSYIKGKKKDCERVGFKFNHYAFHNGVDTRDIISLINHLNNDPAITGIIVQLPLPKGYDADAITGCVSPDKDVDGFCPNSPFKPCTPEGILYVLKQEFGNLRGKHALIIGRGKLVGKPLSKMLLDEDMSVSVCHSKTPSYTIKELAGLADVVVVAAGVPNHFKFNNLWQHTVVIDCGVHRINGRLFGDVLLTNTGNCTPVPGGIGLLTRAMLIKHVERKTTDG